MIMVPGYHPILPQFSFMTMHWVLLSLNKMTTIIDLFINYIEINLLE